MFKVKYRLLDRMKKISLKIRPESIENQCFQGFYLRIQLVKTRGRFEWRHIAHRLSPYFVAAMILFFLDSIAYFCHILIRILCFVGADMVDAEHDAVKFIAVILYPTCHRMVYCGQLIVAALVGC